MIKNEGKNVEKLLVMCFCRNLLDFFVITYNIEEMKQKKNWRNERRRWLMDRFTKKVLIILGVYAFFAIVILILFQTVFMLSYIPSSSMESTIMTGNIVFSTRYDVDVDELKRYDILTFIAPDNPEITYIKRLIGLPGETIEVKEGKVYADGVELDDSFIKNSQNQVGDGIYEIPEGCYFFMGDNRNNSKDSRFWENPYVPIEDIQAKAKCILFPFSDVGSLCYD